MAAMLLEDNRVSYCVTRCQVCDAPSLAGVAFLGYLPPVNTMTAIGQPLEEEPAFPTRLLKCNECGLVQLGTIVNADVLFPPSYPYTSGTTKVLRENFAELYREVSRLYPLTPDDLCVDIGSNDGTLIANFQQGGHRVRGIEPTNAGLLAIDRGIPTLISFFNADAVTATLRDCGPAKIITAANCFAHIDDVNTVVENILTLLTDDGIFINESHYLVPLLETLQYDTIYHEHMRYYSLGAIKHLLDRHGLEVIHARPIPSHGGSIRVYSARRGTYPVQPSVAQMLAHEETALSREAFVKFQRGVTQSKLDLYVLLQQIKGRQGRVYGIGAPSRASTLINYVGLDHDLLDCVLEVANSHKVGKYIPGTMIPVLDEAKLYQDQPEYALLLSWHIADELMPKIKAKGFKGDFLIPLPTPRIVRSADVA